MVESNNAINNTVGASISGVTNTLTVTNPSNTASSVARETITVGGASAGDPSLNFNVSGVTDFEMGIDNNDSDKFKISEGTTLGTNDTFRMTTSGERTMPLQPAFVATSNVTQSNVTGDSTVATLNCTNVLSNIGGHYDGTNTFTAPVDGFYFFNAGIFFTNITAAYSILSMWIITSSFNFLCFAGNGAIRDSVDRIAVCGTAFIFLTAGQTAIVQGRAGASTKTVNYQGAIPGVDQSYFTGYLVQ